MNLDLIDEWRDILELDSRDGVLEAQIMHIGEEYGELLAEWSVHVGSNPRKPRAFRGVEVRKEIADVAISALVLLAMFSNDWRDLLQARLTEVTERVK